MRMIPEVAVVAQIPGVLVVDGWSGANWFITCPREIFDAVDAAVEAAFGPDNWTSFDTDESGEVCGFCSYQASNL